MGSLFLGFYQLAWYPGRLRVCKYKPRVVESCVVLCFIGETDFDFRSLRQNSVLSSFSHSQGKEHFSTILLGVWGEQQRKCELVNPLMCHFLFSYCNLLTDLFSSYKHVDSFIFI